MTLNQVHFQVQDLRAAVDWFTTVLEVRPGFENNRIATFIFGTVTVIIDAGPADSSATLGFESDDCDRDFQIVVHRGAVSIEAPVDGALKCEIEGPVVNSSSSSG